MLSETFYQKLVSNLNHLCTFFDNTYNVNSGGCCWIAAEIAKHLDKLEIPYTLVIYTQWHKDIDYITSEVQNCKQNHTVNTSVCGLNNCYHYCLCLDDNDINISDCDDSLDRYHITNITYKNINWIYKKSSWNRRYDTKYNTTIRRILKEFFKEYENL